MITGIRITKADASSALDALLDSENKMDYQTKAKIIKLVSDYIDQEAKHVNFLNQELEDAKERHWEDLQGEDL
jgi:autonomous glycyl radical cofactor GrcA